MVAKTTYAVLCQEFERIWGRSSSGQFDSPQAFSREVDRRDQAALCLSGGGIRSAAFALGVIQALAKLGLLSRFHYLSTVSGGGYTGAWLSRWITERGGDVAGVEAALRQATEPHQIVWLRDYSNFLTPKLGLLSTDSWTGAVLVVRNILLNWLLLGPLLLIVAAAPNLYLALLADEPDPNWAWLAALAAAGATAIAAAYLPSHTGTRWHQADGGLSKDAVRGWIVAPICFWALVFPLAFAGLEGAPFGVGRLVAGLDSFAPEWLFGPRSAAPARIASLSAFAIAAIASLVGYLVAWAASHRDDGVFFYRWNFLVWIVIAALGAAFIGFGVRLSAALSAALPEHWGLALVATLGPLWLAFAHVAVSALYAAFRITEQKSDGDREWLARLSAEVVRVAAIWAALCAACLILRRLAFDRTDLLASWLTPLAAASTVAAGIGGRKLASTIDLQRGVAIGKAARAAIRSVDAATAVAVVALLAVAAQLELRFAGWIDDAEPWYLAGAGAHILATLALAALLLVAASKIHVNRYSLHGVYRNRLARAFLGAARNSARKADNFTGFDPRDNPRMYQLHPLPSKTLFPVVNMAVNLQSTSKLRWQERKAASFTATPLACGSADLGEQGAFASSRGYGGQEKEVRPPERDPSVGPFERLVKSFKALGQRKYGPDKPEVGISLATAMTISGAAASPSMGYHTRPATAFIMTLLNMRLGAWLPNPAVATTTLARSEPRLAVKPLLAEMLGLANERREDVYLSDGGHFENLGVYEMVRRRCRFILVSDAGADEDCRFEDLGNAVRKCAVDFGARIRFRPISIYSRSKAEGKAEAGAFAIAEIDYVEPDARGWLIYVKPSYFGDMPADVRAYAESNSRFPHEPTSDQWFSESQFESYRRLAEHLVLSRARKGEYADLASFFAELTGEQIWPRGSSLRG